MSDAPADTAGDRSALLEMAAEIVSSHVANNAVAPTDLPGLIETVYRSLDALATPPEPTLEPQKPAVSIRKSITDDFIICLEDGKKMKMLKRHLAVAFGMTPEDYRAKWSLPADYPMVAPSYSEKRQRLAKEAGLGRKSQTSKRRKKR